MKIKNKKIIFFRNREFNPDHFFNRDLSWLEFNFRVLNESVDTRTPLLERLRFCDIWRSNTDEFFQKRVGHLNKKIDEKDNRQSIDGQDPKSLIKEIRKRIEGQTKIFANNFQQNLRPQLQKKGIFLVGWFDLTATDKSLMLKFFKSNILPILTPLAVDSGHPFPFLSNLSKSIGVCLRKPRSKERLFARVKIPRELPQWIRLTPKDKAIHRFVNVDEIICHNLKYLFAGMQIEATTIFRITRSAATAEEDDEGNEDLMELVEEGLRERKFAPIVRLEYQSKPNPWILEFLKVELELEDIDFYEMPNIASYTQFSKILDINLPNLKYPKAGINSVPGLEYAGESEFNIFQAIRKRDFLFHFPYESFSASVETFVRNAAEDPRVRAIKIVLYRTDSEGRLISYLVRAAENGKQVACIIELKARFDEAKNIQWAQKLEEAGIHVTYGVLNYKTHAKMIMVVRQDPEGIRTYVNIGTGNYNSQTSKLYTDFSYFTCRQTIGDEVLEVFNFLTGRSLKHNYKKLLVAPFNMFSGFKNLIEKEIEFHKKKKNGMIIAKMNQLEDPETIETLYKASQAGVKITLIVRGFCSLKPGIANLSTNIKVYSLVGRLLEHSRVYYFKSGETNPLDGKFYIGSGDWMHRNLFDRVEVTVPISQKDLRLKLWNNLNLIINDNRHLWELQANGKYIQRRSINQNKEINAQKLLLNINKV